MARLTDKQIMSIFSLKDNPDFKEFMGHIDASYKESAEKCINKSEEFEIRRAQGSAKSLNDLLESVRNAQDNFKRMKAQRESNTERAGAGQKS